MAEEQSYHVLSLTPKQQYALRLLLFDLYCNFMKKQLEDVAEGSTEEMVRVKSTLLISTFEKYNQMIDMLTNRVEMYKTTTKVLTLAPVIMKNISTAIDSFSLQNTNVTSGSDVYCITQELQSLKTRVNESKQYRYTMEEIEKMKRSL